MMKELYFFLQIHMALKQKCNLCTEEKRSGVSACVNSETVLWLSKDLLC